MTTPVVILGTGSFAEVVTYYFTQDSDYEVVAYAVSADQMTTTEFLGKEVVPFETVEERYSPSTHQMFVCVGYKKLNKVREQLFNAVKAKGYTCASYVCSKATFWEGGTVLGENVFIFEDNTVQPFTAIGDGTILWSGNHIGHHSTIGKHCFITSHVVISGHCTVGDRCMIGVNATVSDSVDVADDNFIGPNALIQKKTKAGEAYIGERTKPFSKPSEFFFK